MRIGVVFPQTEIGADGSGVRAYAEAAEALGYTHLLAYDHVLGADPSVHEGWAGPYDLHTDFHEPFVLFGYLAAFSRLELVTGIIILPQRQTALVAKQAAEVDILTSGRLRLGVGLGCNAVEYEALGKPFGDRGRRAEEQIELLRRFWTEPSVTFEGKSERVIGAGLSPMPVQRPIPIWLGASSERALIRAGRLGDGWFPQVSPGHGLEQAKAVLDKAARDAGRDPDAIGMEGRVTFDGEEDRLGEQVRRWEGAGATHLSVNTMGSGREGAGSHIDAIARASEVIKAR
ncbi:MAG: LLM class F420-dependent oxidoreductase [Acidimicrobiales bacterium]